MTITHSGKKFDLEKEVRRLEKKGIFDKAVSLDYVAVINPFVNTNEIIFNCHENQAFSFKLNPQEIQNKDEEKFWKMISKGGENVNFSGNVNRFYSLGIGELKGYISSLEYGEYDRRLLVGVKNGKVQRVINEINLLAFQAMTAEFPSPNKDKSSVREYFPLL